MVYPWRRSRTKGSITDSIRRNGVWLQVDEQEVLPVEIWYGDTVLKFVLRLWKKKKPVIFVYSIIFFHQGRGGRNVEFKAVDELCVCVCVCGGGGGKGVKKTSFQEIQLKISKNNK